MNLKSISDTELRENTKKVVKKERLIGIEVLQHLKEIDSRKSYKVLFNLLPKIEAAGCQRAEQPLQR